MSHIKEYAVSDHTGAYVFYTDDYREAKKVMKQIDKRLAEDDTEGSAAIMRRVEGENTYELYF